MVAISPALAEPGSLDTSFGGDGKVLTRFGSQDAFARSIAIQADGKIVVAGAVGVWPDGSLSLARYNADGTLDTAFGDEGKTVADFPESTGGASGVAIQADGKIVAGGGGALARYNSDGTLDTTFGGDGVVPTEYVFAVVIQAGGKIVVGGGALARYNTNGTLDTTFAGDGVVGTFARDVAIQADGKIVAVEGDSLARYNPDGTRDATFAGSASLAEDCSFPGDYCWVNTLALQADGRIVVGGGIEVCGGGPGGCGHESWLLRLDDDGTLDTSFSAYCGAPTAEIVSIAIGPDGKIVCAGTSGDGRFAIARHNADGTLDETFTGDGWVRTRFTRDAASLAAVAIQSNGKTIAAGGAEGTHRVRFAVARYLAA